MMSGDERPSEYPTLEVEAAGDKDIGGREHDEDGILVRADLGLYAVADGAGGESAGNVASSIALACLARHYEATARAARTMPPFDGLGLPWGARRLSSGVHRANREVLEIARSSDRYRGMGTTIVALAVDLSSSVVHLAHVGDSRCYRLRAGRLELLTQDHSLAQDVLELSPDIDEATAAKLPRNVITRALGMSESVRVSVRSLDVAIGDRFVLCSDGLTDVLSDEEIAETLLTGGSSMRADAQALVARAVGAAAGDNVAAVVVRVDAGPGVAAVPKRHATRPHPSRPPSVRPLPGDSWQDPEIIVVDDEHPGDGERRVHVVPAGARSSFPALRDVLVPRPRARPAEAPTTAVDEDASDDGSTVIETPDDD